MPEYHNYFWQWTRCKMQYHSMPCNEWHLALHNIVCTWSLKGSTQDNCSNMNDLNALLTIYSIWQWQNDYHPVALTSLRPNFNLHTAPIGSQTIQSPSHPHCPIPSGQEEYLCKNAVHWLQLRIQHHSTLQAHHQAWGPGSQPRPVQLGPGLPDGPPPSGDPLRWSSTLWPHKGACSALSCTPCSHMTAWPCTPPTQSSSLQTTQQLWAWLPTTTRQPTGRRWGHSECGIWKTTSNSTKQRRWSWTSGNSRGNTPYPHRRDSSREGGKLSSSAYTSQTNWNGPPTQTALWRRHNSTSSTSGGWIKLSCHQKHSQTSTDAQSRASCQAVSQPGTANTPPSTTRLSRGWCGLHNASPGANYPHSMTPTAPDITGRPKSSRTTTTRAPACSPRYHPEGEISTGASKLGPRD